MGILFVDTRHSALKIEKVATRNVYACDRLQPCLEKWAFLIQSFFFIITFFGIFDDFCTHIINAPLWIIIKNTKNLAKNEEKITCFWLALFKNPFSDDFGYSTITQKLNSNFTNNCVLFNYILEHSDERKLHSISSISNRKQHRFPTYFEGCRQ